MNNHQVMPPKRATGWCIGVSSCLLGQQVRFDGSHKRNGYIVEKLKNHFDLVSFCPEVAIGMGVPRPPIQLIWQDEAIHARGVEQPELDVTEPLTGYFDSVREQIEPLVGYILKQGSPSCGMSGVRLHGDESGMGSASGLFAARLLAAFPHLPIEQEGRLNDPQLRENFLTRLFVHGRWRDLLDVGFSFNALLEFHSRHKMLLLAHDEATYRRLGRWLAEAGQIEPQQLASHYISELMEGLKQPATPGSHSNVLQHLAGFLKTDIDRHERARLAAAIDRYRQGELPLTAPIALLNQHFQRHRHPFSLGQYYLRPLPAELLDPVMSDSTVADPDQG